MMQVWINPADGQVMAIYRGCKYTGTVWQERGFQEAEAPDNMRITRDHKVALRDGAVTAMETSPNPERPPPPKQMTDIEKIERATGLPIDRLKAALA